MGEVAEFEVTLDNAASPVLAFVELAGLFRSLDVLLREQSQAFQAIRQSVNRFASQSIDSPVNRFIAVKSQWSRHSCHSHRNHAVLEISLLSNCSISSICSLRMSVGVQARVHS